MAQSSSTGLIDLRGLSGKEAQDIFYTLQAKLKKGAQEMHLTLTTPGAARDGLTAYWRPTDGYWVTFEEKDGRHLCSYGVVNPKLEPKQKMLCQINIQSDAPWNVMGALGTDGHSYYYLHSGRLAHRSNFAQRYPGRKARVHWPGHSDMDYFIVADLGDHAAATIGDYVKAIARFRSGGGLEKTYRSEFELGLLEEIRDLEVRIGGADQLAATVQASQLTDSQKAAFEKHAYLMDLDTRLRFDPYLLARPVDRITESVRADRQRQRSIAIGAAILSILAGWLLSAINPGSLVSGLHGVYSSMWPILPWLPH